MERAGEMGLTLPSGRLLESLERAKKDLISVAEACLIDVFGNQVSWGSDVKREKTPLPKNMQNLESQNYTL